MTRLGIGVCLESLGLPIRRGLAEAERLGIGGVQVDAVGDLSPNSLSQTGRRDFLNRLRAHNLALTAIGCPLRHSLATPRGQQQRIDHVRKVISMSFDLGARVVVVQAGKIPDDPASVASLGMTEALVALGHHGDRVGAVLALETGTEPGEAVRRFLDRLGTGGLGINFDPANLLMNGFDIYESARALHSHIVHTHAKDARSARANSAAREVPLGQGDLDWLGYLAVLEEIGYRGWLTIERETGDQRLADVAAGVAFLRRLVG